MRIDKGKPPPLYETDHDFSAGLARLKKGRDLMIVATGIMVPQAFKIAEALAGQGVAAGIIDIYRLKPLNEELLLRLIGAVNRIVTLEE